MNAKFSVFDIHVEAIIYLLLYNLHDRTFKVVITSLIEMLELPNCGHMTASTG